MRNSVSKAIVAAIAALTISAALVLPTARASAVMLHGGGFGGGMHGGGFHPGLVAIHPGVRPGFMGVHPAFRPHIVAFNHAFRPRFVAFHHRRFFHRGFFGPTVVAGVNVGGGYGDYGAGCWVYRPLYDAAGDYLGQGYVNICSYSAGNE